MTSHVDPHALALRAIEIARAADGYGFGAETVPGQRGGRIDCSELIEQACAEMGVDPPMPDGTWLQAQHCERHRALISVADALATEGALLFYFSVDGVPSVRPNSAHVAMSLGDGRTVEARSTASGVGIFEGAATRNWTLAAAIPGVDYIDAKKPKRPKPLKSGDQGCRVAALQQAINEALALDVDGDFGPKTRARVREWQRSIGARRTGRITAAQAEQLGIR